MSSDEKVIVFNSNSPDKTWSKSRKIFYDEQFQENDSKPDEGVEVISVFLVNTHGDVLLQKRSPTKRHNPNLLDKTVGGHIQYGESPDYTVMVETVQELLTPSIVLRTDEDFTKTFNLLKDYLDTIAVINHISTDVVVVRKLSDGIEKKITNKVHTYFGVYNGSTRPVDREALGILAYPLETLISEIKQHPDNFTHDIVLYMQMYGKKLKEFIKNVNYA